MTLLNPYIQRNNYFGLDRSVLVYCDTVVLYHRYSLFRIVLSTKSGLNVILRISPCVYLLPYADFTTNPEVPALNDMSYI